MSLIKNKVLLLLLFLGVVVGGVSCVRDLQKSIDELEKVNRIKFDPEFALPLVNSSLSLADLVKRVNTDLIYEDDNRLLHAVYRGELVTVEAQDFIDLEDQVTQFSLGLSQSQIDNINNSGSTKITLSGLVNYNLFDIELDSMLTKICRSIVQVSSDLQHDLSIDVLFPHIKKAGQAFGVNSTANYQGNLPVSSIISQDLKGYLFDMTKANEPFNQLKIEIEITITKQGNNPLSTSDSIRFKSGFYFNEFETLWGYVGQSDISPTPDTTNISLFSSSDKGTFTVNDPSIKLYIYNSFGIPVEAKVKDLSARIPGQGKVDITGIPSPLPIPVLAAGDRGKTLVDSIVLNSSNSNFKTIINDRPQSFAYDFDVQVNPGGSGSARNFIMDTSKLTFEIDVDVPLDGTAKDFGLEQEQDFSLDIGVDSIELLDYAIFRIALDNSFPMEFAFQVVFLDSAGQALDSLVNEEFLVIKSGVVDANGDVIAPGRSVHDFTIDQMRLRNIDGSKKILLKAMVTTPSYQGSQVPVKFYSHHKLDFRMGVQVKAKIDEEL